MGNPIFDNQPNGARENPMGGIFGLLNQVRNSPDPNMAMQNLASTNPQIQGVMNYIRQNGGDARSAFYNLAAEKGVDPNSILNQLR